MLRLRTGLEILTIMATMMLVAAPALAQAHVGVRAGASADPNQFFFGAHIETKEIAPHVTFRPNVEIGFGDDMTALSANFEVVYSIPLKRQPWRVYVGGGPAANFYFFNDGSGNGDDTDFGGGINFVGGLQHRGGFFTEIKFGVIDSPDFKFTVGYAFR